MHHLVHDEAPVEVAVRKFAVGRAGNEGRHARFLRNEDRLKLIVEKSKNAVLAEGMPDVAQDLQMQLSAQCDAALAKQLQRGAGCGAG